MWLVLRFTIKRNDFPWNFYSFCWTCNCRLRKRVRISAVNGRQKRDGKSMKSERQNRRIWFFSSFFSFFCQQKSVHFKTHSTQMKITTKKKRRPSMEIIACISVLLLLFIMSMVFNYCLSWVFVRAVTAHFFIVFWKSHLAVFHLRIVNVLLVAIVVFSEPKYEEKKNATKCKGKMEYVKQPRHSICHLFNYFTNGLFMRTCAHITRTWLKREKETEKKLQKNNCDVVSCGSITLTGTKNLDVLRICRVEMNHIDMQSTFPLMVKHIQDLNTKQNHIHFGLFISENFFYFA